MTDTTVEAQRRRIAGALFLSLLMLWGTFEAQPVFIDALLRQFGWSHAAVSWLPAISSLGIGIIGPPAGLLLDRFDARYVMSGGAILVGAGLLLSAQCHGLDALLAATLLYSVGLGASTVLPASTVIANWYEARRRGTAIGVTLSGMEVGGMALTALCGMAIAAYGWRAGFVLAGVPALVMAAPLLFAVVRTRPKQAFLGKAEGHARTGLSLGEALGTPVFWGLAGVQLASGLLIGGLFPFAVSYFVGLGYTPATAVLIVTASYGAVIVGKPLLGVLADRIGGRAGLLIGFTGWVLVSFGLMAGSRPWSAAVFLLFIGISLPAAIALVPTIIAATMGLRRFGAIYGWLQVANTVGLFLGPLLIGGLADFYGSYAAAFRALLVIAGGGIAAALLCRPNPAPILASVEEHHG